MFYIVLDLVMGVIMFLFGMLVYKSGICPGGC